MRCVHSVVEQSGVEVGHLEVHLVRCECETSRVSGVRLSIPSIVVRVDVLPCSNVFGRVCEACVLAGDAIARELTAWVVVPWLPLTEARRVEAAGIAVFNGVWTAASGGIPRRFAAHRRVRLGRLCRHLSCSLSCRSRP